MFISVIHYILGDEDDVPATIVIGDDDGKSDNKPADKAHETNSAQTASLPALKTVFDCKMVVKRYKTTGELYWSCLHCNDCNKMATIQQGLSFMFWVFAGDSTLHHALP